MSNEETGRWVDGSDFLDADDIRVGVSRRYEESEGVPGSPTHVAVQMSVTLFEGSDPLRATVQLALPEAEQLARAINACTQALREGRVPTMGEIHG